MNFIHLGKLIEMLIESKEGLAVEIFELGVWRNEDGSFTAGVADINDLETFDTASEAVTYFLEQRKKLRLGFDFETEN